ncbi:MAG: hypothetical protein ABIJ95_12520, partial [Pseudomonadota bacterium]
NGSAMIVDGRDDCGMEAGLPPIYTLIPSITNVNGDPILEGNPASIVQGPSDIDIQASVDAFKENATEEIQADVLGDAFGGPDDFVTVFSDTSNPYNVGGLKLSNITGFGILLVDGDLTLGGGFQWNGLVLVTGTLVFNGGGAGVNIQGAVLANQTVDINGGIDIQYNSCMVGSALSSASMKFLSMRDMNLF